MNPIIAATLFENPLVLAALVLAGMLANWLMKRWGKARAEVSPDEGQSPMSTGELAHPPREPDLQDILRQLLRGEPPIMAPAPPPLPRSSRDHQTPPDESREPHERRLRQRKQADEQSSALAARIEAEDRQENAAHDVVSFGRPAEHPAWAMGTARGRHSRGGAPGVRLWRDARIVRRAFVASLVFAPPKGLEA